MTAPEQQNRPGGGSGAAQSVVATRDQDTGAMAHWCGGVDFTRPAPVDAREDGLTRFDFEPLPTEDHPLHPLSDWNLYRRPPVQLWGSYLDLTPIPLDQCSPVGTLSRALEAGIRNGGVRRA